MDFSKLLGYLDYGVLGLSAIILIFSFVLLSREQSRDEFRPVVASAIQRYMRMALVFAGIALLAMIVESILIKPSKEEKQKLEELEKMMDAIALREVDNQYQINMQPSMKPVIAMDSVAMDSTASNTIPRDNYTNLRNAVFSSLGRYGGNEKIFKQVMDSMIVRHPELKEYEEKIEGEHKEIKKARINWLENSAIPKLEENKKNNVDNILPIAVDWPKGFSQATKEVKYIHPMDYDNLKSELKVLKK